MPPPADSGNGGGAGAPTASGGRGPKGPGARGNNIAVHVAVEGHVQGVFFRDSCAKEARRQGLAGWVKNRGDGRVEAWFEGDAPAVENLVAWCRQGPPHARVAGVEVSQESPAGLEGFRIQ